MRKSIVLDGWRLSYEFERKRVRHVNLRIRADGSVYVSAPLWTPVSAVEALLHARQDWILAHLQRRQEQLSAQAAPDRVFLWGDELRLQLREGTRRRAQREGDVLILTLKNPADEEEKRRALDAWQKQLCAERVTALCRRYYPAFEQRGVAFPRLSFRRMRSRWGSCRPQKGALSFNTRLTELPPGCADYVVVHELAHFLQPNHSAAFYAEVARVLPDWKARRDAIRAWERSHPL